MRYTFGHLHVKLSLVALLTSMSMSSMSCGDSLSCGGAATPAFVLVVSDGHTGELICDATVTIIDNAGQAWPPEVHFPPRNGKCPYSLLVDPAEQFTVDVHADGYQPYQIHHAATAPVEHKPCVYVAPISLFAELEPL